MSTPQGRTMHHLARCGSYLTKDDAPSHAAVAHRRMDLAQVGVICCGHRHLVERAKFTPAKSDMSSLSQTRKENSMVVSRRRIIMTAIITCLLDDNVA
jgi:hypothetical protein